MRRTSFAEAPIDDGTAALNRVFEDYLVPIAFSPEQLQLHMSYNDVDPALSPIWFDERGSVLAAALLAIRGQRGWIGGFGVAPEYRGQGYATALIDHMLDLAKARQLKSLTLEVLCQNTAAIAVYRNAGFGIGRRLLSFEKITEDAQMPTGFAYASPDDLWNEAEATRPCWQRENASLRNGAASSAVTDGNGSYALFRSNASVTQILKIQAHDAGKLTTLANALSAGHRFQNLLLLNEPEQSPLTALAQDSNWNEQFIQYEMQLTLS
jgi:GNAT superfamily N-acetyltransferase